MAMSSYQPQLIKAREFIFTEPEVISTPLLNRERKLQIIMQQSLFTTGRLQSRCERMGVTVDKPRRVTTPDFQACLQYSLLARLAPLWNKAGDYLMQGRDFVMNNQKMNAVKMELRVNDQELFLALKAFQIRLPPIKVCDLGVPMAVLTEFMEERPHATIQEYSIVNKWIYVLPSMKRGMVVGVLHAIPADSPFKSYKDMKRYWKNTYGYRLPELEEGMLYYQIYFKPIGDKLFTYPECCVRARDVVTLPRADTVAIMSAFLTDLHAKQSTVCATKIRFAEKGLFPTPGLMEIPDMAESTEHGFNLVSQPVQKRPFYRPITAPQQTTWQPSMQSYKTSQQLYGPSQQRDRQHQGCDQSAGAIPTSQRLHQNSYLSDLTQLSAVHQNNDNSKLSTNMERLLSAQKSPALSNALSEHIEALKSTGVATKNLPQTNSEQNATCPKYVASHLDKLTSAVTTSSVPGKIRPVFKPKFTSKPFIPHIVTTSRAQTSVKKVPTFKAFNKPAPTTSNDIPETTRLENVSKPTFKPMSKQNLPSFTGAKSSAVPSFLKPHLPAVSSCPGSSGKPNLGKLSHMMTTERSGKQAESSSGYESMPRTPNIVHSSPMSRGVSTPCKRKMPAGDADTPSQKKPRAKPKIQEDVDMAALAANQQLSKVNTATLVNWLKDRKVACKSKDKKGDLLAKVYTELGLTEQ